MSEPAACKCGCAVPTNRDNRLLCSACFKPWPRATDAAYVWLVVADCGDYYCEGAHVVAVAASEEDAVRLRAEADAATHHYRSHGPDGRRYKTFAETSVERVPLDVLRHTEER